MDKEKWVELASGDHRIRLCAQLPAIRICTRPLKQDRAVVRMITFLILVTHQVSKVSTN